MNSAEEMWALCWRDGSAGKAFALQAWGPESDPRNSEKKKKMEEENVFHKVVQVTCAQVQFTK